MRPKLRALAARQGGLITRQQALAAGYLDGEIRDLSRTGGPWALVRRGVYAERETLEAVTSREGRLLLRDHAAHLTMTRPHLMSHDSAARALQLPQLRPEVDLVHITRFGVGGSRTEEGVKHHLTRLGLLGAVEQQSMRITGLARTALDVAREHGLVQGIVACDAVRQRGVPLGELDLEVSLMRSWPGVRTARAAVESSDGGAETIGETLTRLLVVELGIGEPDTQFPVPVQSGVAWADMRVGRHLFEFDGMVKFTSVEDGGVARVPADEVWRQERRRQHEMCAHGLGMSRVGWEDLWGRRREATAHRLVAEHQVTVARFGDVLPAHLAEFAARVRASRPRVS